jgi:hypothetical protein
MRMRGSKLAPTHVFVNRLLRSIAFSSILIFATLGMGVLGYHHLAGLDWIDSLLNASMILGGMGPVDTLTSNQAKIFASVYALFCGLVLVGATGLVLSPILHRMLHRFQIDEEDFA